MIVQKFGGTSLETPERIATVVGIIRAAAQQGSVAVVVSAFGGVTNALERWARETALGTLSDIDELERRCQAMVEACAGEGERGVLEDCITAMLGELRDLLHGVALLGECSARTCDLILSHGERLSATVVAAALRNAGTPAEACDARTLVATDDRFGAARVDQQRTFGNIRAHFRGVDTVQIVAGFIGSTETGETTTLGRGGSDLTAALLAAALQAERIEIWTDVDGVMSADPRLVPKAFSLPHLTYDELVELSHFGAKVVYPPTVHPARAASVPLVIKNAFNPEFAGTTILEKVEPAAHLVRGISSVNNVALIRLEGDGMVGIPGIAMRLFDSLASHEINVIMISQASSEHSICFAVLPDAVHSAKKAIHDEFVLERRAGLIDDLVVEEGCAIIAAVGEGMREKPGIAGRIFGILGDRRINVRAIAQGSSELNISLVLDRRDEARAMNAIHDAFFVEERATNLFLIGKGRVGSVLIEQLATRRQEVRKKLGEDIHLAGTSRTEVMWLDEGLAEAVGRADPPMAVGETPADLERMIHLVCNVAGSRVVVDCTASDETARYYPALLNAGVAVVSANKRPFTDSMASYRELQRAAHARRTSLFYETTVGAGLPVLSTLRNLIETGDTVVRVEGVFSGTLAYLMHRIGAGQAFSDVVREAHAAGYTEPDPRDDLSGMDVARKLLILARETGRDMELEDVKLEPLISDQRLEDVTLDEFWELLPALDEPYRQRQDAAMAGGHMLCYLARLDEDGARVGLEEIDPEHVCAVKQGSDNVFAFHTTRYCESPLVVRGPGAGLDVTAAGVFADVLEALAVSRER